MLDSITEKNPPIVPMLASDAGTQAYYEQQRKEYDAHLARYMADKYLHSPRLLAIETYMKCNASCEFCPYPTSDRIGQRLETEIIQKIIDEVAASGVAPEYFMPAHLSEPMLDRRMFQICDYVAKKLPQTKIGHATNGTTLNERNVERLAAMPNLGYISVSLNSHEPEEHKRLMGISFDLVVKNLRRMHHAKEAGKFKTPVNLSRVGDGTRRDVDFIQWCKEHFPLFSRRCNPRFDWLGKTYAIDTGRIPSACTQWYQLSFLANAREAFCCMDDDGRFGRGDAHVENALDIYNHPTRLGLRQKKLRSGHPACAACTALR